MAARRRRGQRRRGGMDLSEAVKHRIITGIWWEFLAEKGEKEPTKREILAKKRQYSRELNQWNREFFPGCRDFGELQAVVETCKNGKVKVHRWKGGSGPVNDSKQAGKIHKSRVKKANAWPLPFEGEYVRPAWVAGTWDYARGKRAEEHPQYQKAVKKVATS